jgi:hypothetical protein
MLSDNSIRQVPRCVHYHAQDLDWKRFKISISEVKPYPRVIRGVSIISGTSVAICTALVVVDSTSMYWKSVYQISRTWMDVMNFYVLSF